MKQKYKVFINDQEIVFQALNTPESPHQHSISCNYSPPEIYHEVVNNPQPTGYTFNILSENPLQSFNAFRDYFTCIEASGGLVRLLHKDGKLLMIYRLGKWDLPKGKIEPGEKHDTAALREVEEECGITSLEIIEKIGDTFHMYEHKGIPVLKITHWYLMITTDEGTPVPQTEEGISMVRWVAIDELSQFLPDCYRSIADLIHSAVLD